MRQLTRNLLAASAGALVMSLTGLGSTARAFPPTVTVSPGYDARLAESRKAREAKPAPVPRPTPKRKHPARK
jgi:hypothetical protein